jgi:hypothetical protein
MSASSLRTQSVMLAATAICFSSFMTLCSYLF